VRPAVLFVFLALLFGLSAPSAAPMARPIVVVGTNQSFNWSGYMQGSLEKGTSFHAVAADWIVPKAKPHRHGEAEYSSSWIGIGGGCLDSECKLFDATLIQAGIGHDVDASGNADYYAWWETIPAPLIRVDLPVSAGDRVHVEIVEAATPGIWTITILNRDTAGSFSVTLPYTSTYGSAEWVIETPVVITERGVTVGPMPDLARVHFDLVTANGLPAKLVIGEQIQLVEGDLLSGELTLIAKPSAPDKEADGFNDCAYHKSCPAPGHDLK
jgi:peptidase A4-like protein